MILGNNPTLFVDMDGVLTDFDGHLQSKFNELGIDEFAPDAHRNVSNNFIDVMDAYGHEFFQNIPPSPHMEWFKNLFEHIPLDIDVCILSATDDWGIGGYESISIQKMKWLEDYEITPLVSKTIFVKSASQKKNYAHENAILIDDSPSNISQFINADGTGVLYHSKSHLKDAAKLVRELRNLSEKIKES